MQLSIPRTTALKKGTEKNPNISNNWKVSVKPISKVAARYL